MRKEKPIVKKELTIDDKIEHLEIAARMNDELIYKDSEMDLRNQRFFLQQNKKHKAAAAELRTEIGWLEELEKDREILEAIKEILQKYNAFQIAPKDALKLIGKELNDKNQKEK